MTMPPARFRRERDPAIKRRDGRRERALSSSYQARRAALAQAGKLGDFVLAKHGVLFLHDRISDGVPRRWPPRDSQGARVGYEAVGLSHQLGSARRDVWKARCASGRGGGSPRPERFVS